MSVSYRRRFLLPAGIPRAQTPAPGELTNVLDDAARELYRALDEDSYRKAPANRAQGSDGARPASLPAAVSATTTADDLQRRLGYSAPTRVLAAALRELFPGRVAVVSSFGAESAVLLHLVAAIDRATPVVFIDTSCHFAETLRYRDALTAHLGLSDVRSIGPTAEEIARLDGDTTRAIWDPDGCCAFRKTQPLQRALAGFEAWITGRKRFQATTRFDLPVFEADAPHIKINPLASWSTADLAAYVTQHRLPPHPLLAKGFASIGCAPCTSAQRPGEEARAGRWRGLEKTECGIHQQRPTGK
jgi:phosphoadenosine phosphosulfate reductase